METGNGGSMKLLVQRYFMMWSVDHEAALVFTGMVFVWLVVIGQAIYFFVK